jgi:hypothetical protein
MVFISEAYEGGGAGMTTLYLLWEAKVFGILIPALVLAVAFVVTFLLYRHFSEKKYDGDDRP